VGFSVGALWERLYAAQYPDDIAGMIMVDHAFLPDGKPMEAHQAGAPASSHRDNGPALIAQAPIVFRFEDDVNFGRLPQRDQELHKWAVAQNPVRPDEAMALDCFNQICVADGDRPFPLGGMSLTVIRTENESPGYAELQAKLLALSHRSRQVVAWDSSHMVPIDQPEVIVSAIQKMIETTRGH
jgi:pimeloyl-ACP methyl ester carboxylesterase